ncbi:unnamed protein product [Hymenolepis diminuta]|uniref:Uncharacterized protein n=1 Tax=Hymenolepis diminuta TaxID=6216 RepID=A0A564XV06_HYMDI|nr:unnamed protein product [Hymenolepis diminuta]
MGDFGGLPSNGFSHLNRIRPHSKDNNADPPLEINSRRIHTLFSIHWCEGTPFPLLDSSSSSSSTITRPPRQQFRGAESPLVPSHSTDDQDPSVWKVDSNTQLSFFNHVCQRRPPGRRGQLFLHHS